MVTCFYYWLIQPLRAHYEDTSSSVALMSTTLHTLRFADMTIGVFGDGAGPSYARVVVPNLPSEEIPVDLMPLLQAVREHLLSTLRLTLHPEATLWERPLWTFSNDALPNRLAFSLEQNFADPLFDADRARNIFDATFDMRDEVRLFVDAADSRIPLQYAYLSLYKIIELHFKTDGRWRKSETQQFLSAFTDRFLERGIRSSPFAYLTDIRDRCAHIKTGTRHERIGVTHLNHADLLRVYEIMPLAAEVAISILNIRGKGQVKIERRPESWLRWQEQLATNAPTSPPQI
jgi:hypothetical protein